MKILDMRRVITAIIVIIVHSLLVVCTSNHWNEKVEGTWQSDVERSNGIIEFELLEVDRWQSRSEPRQRRGNLVGKSSVWEYYFNRIRPNSYHNYQTPYQRMKRAGIPSKMAEQACYWTVTILDDLKYKNLNFILP